MAEYLIQDTTLYEIAEAIRSRTKKTDEILVSDMAKEIRDIVIQRESVVNPSTTSIPAYTYYQMTSIPKYITFEKVKTVGAHAFTLTRVKKLKFLVVTSIDTYGLNSEDLECLILSGSTVPTLGSNALVATQIAKGLGYIYVTDSLIDSYKSDAAWSTYANQIKPISEYTE